MKIIYQVVLVACLTQIQFSFAQQMRVQGRNSGGGRAPVNVVNQAFRASYNVSSQTTVDMTQQGPRHKGCEAPKVCRAPTLPELQDYTDFMFNFTRYTNIQEPTPEQAASDCSCLDNKFREELGPRFLMEMNKERAELNEKILKSASKKFLNDYASNIEDASFFLLKTSGVFTDQESAKEIQCNDYKKFDDMVFATCGEDVSRNPAKFEAKKLAVLNALGGASRPGMNFDQRIRDISRQIQFLPIPGQTSRDGSPLKFSRTIYDNSRIGLSRSPEGEFVQHIIQKMILNPEVHGQIQEELKTKTPLEAVMRIIGINLDDSETFLKKIGADKSITGELTDMSEIREDFKFLMQTHPGFLNVMGKDASFNLLMKAIKDEPALPLLEQLETKPAILGPLLVNRCDDLTKQFADVVCTKDEDLVKSVDAADLEEIMHSEQTVSDAPEEPELHELLMCLESGKDVKAAFGHLADLEKENNYTTRRSDYLERLIEPDITKHKNLFSVTMLRSVNDRGFRKEMERYAEVGRSLSKAVSLPGVVAHEVYVQSVAEGNDFTIGKSTISKSEARDFMKTVAAAEAISTEPARVAAVSRSETTDAQTTVTDDDVQDTKKIDRRIASDVPMATFSSGSVRQESEVNRNTDQRQMLSRDLARSNPEPEVQRHVSKLDDATISQLTSLRNMNSSLMSQMIADEEKKLQEFRDRLSNVSSNLAASVPVALPETSNIIAPVATERSVAEVGPRSASAATRGANTSANSMISSREEEATISTVSAERRGGGESLPSQESSNADLSLTIVSNQRAQSNDQSSEVIDSEVSTYLETKEFRPSELEDLIRNGLKYQYQVVVNDVIVTKEKIIPFNSLPEKTKRELETRYARDFLEVQTSKLAVLRMLMNNTVVR